MAEPFVGKTELLRRLFAGKAELDAVLAKLSSAQSSRPHSIGPWSVKDLLAHFIAHEQRALEELRCALGGERPNLSVQDNDAFNLGALLSWRAQSFEQVQAAWDHSFDEIIRSLEGLDQADFNPASRVAELLDDSLDGALANNSYQHYAEHKAELERLLGEG